MSILKISLPPSLYDTRYLSAAGLTILVYDHVLLLSHEVQYIWKAKSSWFKWLFLYNHYTVPAYLIINALALGPYPGNLTTDCRNWLTAVSMLIISSISIVNVFVAQRIYILWSFNKAVLKLVTFGILSAYTGSFVVSAIGIAQTRPYIAYNTLLKTCTTLRITKLLAIGLGIPLFLELLNFFLLCLNALHRPRHLHMHIIKQLYFDNVVYFWVVTILRVINIAAVAGAFTQENTLLFAFFLWAMVPTIVHRMILTLNDHTGKENDLNGTDTLAGSWFSPHSIVLRTFANGNSSDTVVDETHNFKDAAF